MTSSRVHKPNQRTIMQRSWQLILSLAAMCLLAACSTTGAEPAVNAPHTPQTAETPQISDELRLGLTEWNIETGDVIPAPGDVQVEVTNAGGTAHDVIIHGQLGSWGTPALAPGETHSFTISVVAGEELELVCTLTGHHAQGMHTTLTVAQEDE